MQTPSFSTFHVFARVSASLLGGYAFVWGVTSLGITVGVAAGLGYHESETWMKLSAFLVFLGAFCWAYVAVSLRRVWAVLAGGGALMTSAAWLLSRTLI